MTRSGLSLHPSRTEDGDFLRRLFASSREQVVALVDWSEDQKEAFLSLQFEAQRRQYQERFPHAAFDIVMDGRMPIGRLYVDRQSDPIQLIDITLLPEHRGKGIGGSLICRLLSDAQAVGKNVSLHVALGNPARHLYERLGFRVIEQLGPYELMEWRCGGTREDTDPDADRL